MTDDAETVVEHGPPAPPSAPSQQSQHTMATSVAMRSEELGRARAFYRLTAILTAIAAGFMPIVPGPRVLRGVVMALCAVIVITNTIALRRLRDETLYTPRFVAMMGALLGVVAELILFYCGLFTAAVMVLPLGVYFFGLSESRFAARSTYLIGALGYGFLSIGVVVGALPDLGPLPLGAIAMPWKWFFVVMGQVVFAITYLLARSSRRATETAIARVDRANRQIFQKEELLAEARIELDRALRPGEGRYTDQIVGGWTLAELLGRGGMGEVYRATRGSEVAAIKLLHAYISNDPSHVKRFEREAELARKVDSPYVARVIGSGTGLSGVPFVAMELLVGKDLGWHLRQKQRMKLGAVVELVDHGAKALVAIRDAGIVHRDLKPQNFVLETNASSASRGSASRGVWKVLDFGVSRLEASGNTLTQGALVGTPAYMAPEQARMGDVDHRADVYSLAAVAYRALTGKPLFSGPDIASTIYRVVHDAPAAPSAFTHIPDDVELVLAIGLAKEADERFQRAEDLASAFARAARDDLDEPTRARAKEILGRRPWMQPREGDAA